MQQVTFETDGAVGLVTLKKPPHNLMDDAMIGELEAAYEAARDSGCRAIVLRSAMRHFCAGADLDQFSEATIQADQARWTKLMDTLEDIPIPTVAAVNGGALGGGLELALTCDMILAADTAFLGQVEVSVGLIPLLGGTQRLAQRVGPARAKEIAMFGRRHSPAALERWGVINLVVPEEELGSVSLSWARQLAAGPTVALNCVKQQANLSARGGIGLADASQVTLNDVAWRAKDRARGFAAFGATGPGSALYQGD